MSYHCNVHHIKSKLQRTKSPLRIFTLKSNYKNDMFLFAKSFKYKPICVKNKMYRQYQNHGCRL